MLLAISYDAFVIVSHSDSMQSPSLDLYDTELGTMSYLQMADAVVYHAGAAVSNGTNELLYAEHMKPASAYFRAASLRAVTKQQVACTPSYRTRSLAF